MERKKRDTISTITIVGMGIVAFLVVFSLGVFTGIHRVESQKRARAVQMHAVSGKVAVSQPPAVPHVQIASEKSATSVITSPAITWVQEQATSAPTANKEVLAKAALKKGKGVEHPLIRQLHERHKDKGLQWAQRRAHKFAVLAGLVGPKGEIRVKNGANIKKGVSYVLDEDESHILTFFDGQEVRRTPIAAGHSHVQPVTPLPFEYVHIPT